MKKKLITIIALAALIIGLVAGNIPAASAASAADEGTFQVGYSKQDVNPWIKSAYTGDLGIENKAYTDNHIIDVALSDDRTQKMVSVPLAGYSSALTRLSTEMCDDNGDGVVGLGDGLFVTCTVVSDQYGTNMVFVTLDGIGAFDKLVTSVRTTIPTAIKELGGIVTASQVMFSTSHSHEGTDFDTMKANAASGSAWEAYYNYAVDQITKAAVEAYKTKTEVVMTKGEVDAKEATAAMGYNSGKGYEMNTVRHYYMINGYGSSRTYIGAGEFNNFSDLIYSTGQKADVPYKTGMSYQSPVAEANDTMYLLQFTPKDQSAGQKPIVLLNWRAHPSAIGGTDATVISSDYINSLRNGLEKEGYCVSFFQGASGNINPRNASLNSNSWHHFETGYSSSVAGTAEAAPKNTNIYGRLLAEVALYGLENCMTDALDTSMIKSKYLSFDATRTTGTTFKHPIDAIALGKEVMILVGAGEYFDRYDANYKTNYKATYQKYTETWFGMSHKMVTTSINTYDLPQLVYGKDEGINVSGYTYNEWNSLIGDFYGTPFFFGYSSTRNGYVPNAMAYDYNTGLTGDYASTPTLTDGTTKAFETVSYEVTASGNLAKGEGEKIIAAMKQLTEELTHEMTAGFEIADANGNVSEYNSFADALRDYDAGGNSPETATNYIKLYRNLSEDITLTEDLYLDLNGKKITGNVTVESGTLYCMDSYTDDYNVEDGQGYAVITGTVTGDLQGLPEGSPISGNARTNGTTYYPGYLMIDEDGVLSFHRVDLGLEYVNFKPEDVGVSYTANFSGDQVVARHVQQYGVAISIAAEPNADNMTTQSGYSIFTNYTAGKNTGKSTRLVNILNKSFAEKANKKFSESPIYGRAYLLTDAGYVFGASTAKSMKEIVEAADAQINANTSDSLKKMALDMYCNFESIISAWNVPNIKNILAEEEDNVIKILMIGNSHGVDATKQLNEVFKKAAPGQKVVIGALYHSGCRIDQHLSYIENNEGNYIYYKINETMMDWTRTPKHKVENGVVVSGEQSNGNVLGGVTLDHGLLDERWDYITLQQMSTYAAHETASYNFDRLEELINYVRTNAKGNPKLYWFDTWAHPNDDVRVATYSGTGYGSQWYKNHVDFFGLSQHEMYNQLINNVKTKIVPLVEAGKLDGIIDSATAVQYMQDVLGLPEYQVYRDGTHLSDYARVMVSALWYSTFTGDTTWTADDLPNWIYTDLGTKSYRADQNISPAMREDIVKVLNYTLNPENQFKLPEGTVESPRLQYVNEMDGVWVCGDITADLKNAKTVAGIAVQNVKTTKYTVADRAVTAEDNDVTITLAGVGDVLLSRTGVNTMKVKSIPSGLTGISVGSVFTFQAN